MSNPRLRHTLHSWFVDPRNVAPARLARVTVEDHIKESLRALLLLQPGERAFHPELGCGLRQFLFRPLTEGLKRDIATQISQTMQKQEPRIHLISVVVEGDKEEKSRLGIQLEYRVLQSQRIDNLKITVQP